MIQLRPSSAHSWVNCSAYPRFVANITPEPEGDPAREGTCAAWVAENVLTGVYKTAIEMIGLSHENAWVVELSMCELIQRYVDKVRSHGGQIHTERKVRLNKMIAGTPDSYAIVSSDGTLYVDDLKYGYKVVEPYKNEQISIYAGAILRKLSAYDVVIRKVVIGVYQPRASHPQGIYRTWNLLPEELMKFVQSIEAAGVKCQDPNAVATPGDHCEYCPAAATCFACGHSVYKHMSVIENQHQRHMDAEQLSIELKFLDSAEKILKARKNAVRTEATARIKRSEHIPGWHLEHQLGDRKLKVSGEVVKAITGKNPYKGDLITPAALERAGVPSSVVNALSTRPHRPPTLKPISSNYFTNLFKMKGT